MLSTLSERLRRSRSNESRRVSDPVPSIVVQGPTYVPPPPVEIPYEPLHEDNREIRLISLHPGNWDDDICCTTKVVSLDSRPHYEALSYAWGDLEDTTRIFIDDHPFQATRNLESALRYLRKSAEPRKLWVDALSIDQRNQSEKSWQVNIMGQIYSSCTQAILWVGKEIEEVDAEFAPDFNSNTDSLIFPAVELIRLLAKDKHLSYLHTVDLGNLKGGWDHAFQGLGALSRRAWWRRIWTVQESILPKSAILKCGFHELEWTLLAKARNNLVVHESCCRETYEKYIYKKSHIRHAAGNFITAVEAVQTVRDQTHGSSAVPFLSLYYRFLSRRAKDPRDKVYALLSLLDESDRPVSPDYSISIEDLCRKLTLKFLQAEAMSFYSVRDFLKPSKRHPSWVVDFSTPSNTLGGNIARHRYRQQKIYCASKARKRSLRMHNDSVLAVQGTRVDTIIAIACDHPDAASINVRCLKQWMQLLQLEHTSEVSYATGLARQEAFLKLILGDAIVVNATSYRLNRERLVKLRNWFDFLVHNRVYSYSKASSDEFENQACYFLYQRRLFITEKGYWGLGPKVSRPGDDVYILFGDHMPCVLRPAEPRPEDQGVLKASRGYHHIGDCYVQGIMDGEYLNDRAMTESTVYIR
jgi:hypothetical protein